MEKRELLDLNIQSGRWARCYKFRAERLKDYNRLESLLTYACTKIEERYRDIKATPFEVKLFEQDGDNIIKNLVTARISFEYLCISN